MTVFRFKPVYQTYLWGGTRLKSFCRRPDAPDCFAESWEISDRPEGMSVVANGSMEGRTLAELLAEMGEKLVGRGKSGSRFPLLVKLIDAQEHLSVQIHPDERSAEALKGEAKSEAWIALAESRVFAGAVDLARLPLGLIERKLSCGEAIYIPAGTVHAICAGSLIFEVQQNSNTTYRLFDWGRGRPLQIREAALSFRPHVPPSPLLARPCQRIFDTPYFRIDRIQAGRLPLDESTFQILFCEKGAGYVEVDGHVESFAIGDTLLVAASAQKVCIEGPVSTIAISQPE